MVTITSKVIQKRAKNFNISTILRLDLSSTSLSAMNSSDLLLCSSLVSLNLSHNRIETIENIASLTNLERLDLSFNRITTVPLGAFVPTTRTNAVISNEDDEDNELLPGCSWGILVHNNINNNDGMNISKSKLTTLMLEGNRIHDLNKSTGRNNGSDNAFMGLCSLRELSFQKRRRLDGGTVGANTICGVREL